MDTQALEDFLELAFAPSRKAVRNLVNKLTLWNPHTGDKVDEGTGAYFIEKYSGTDLDGVPLHFTRGGEYFVCTIEFLRQLKQAHKEHIEQQSKEQHGTRYVHKRAPIYRAPRRKQNRYHQKQSIRWYQRHRNRNRTQRRAVFNPRRYVLEKGKSNP